MLEALLFELDCFDILEGIEIDKYHGALFLVPYFYLLDDHLFPLCSRNDIKISGSSGI